MDGAAQVASEEPLAAGIVLQKIKAELRIRQIHAINIVIIADLHCNSESKRDMLIDAFAKLAPRYYDMVFLLGDFGEDEPLLPPVMRAIAGVNTRHGIYCVRGNHDYEGHRAELIKELADEYSITILSNAACEIPELKLQLIGLESPWRRGTLPPRLETRYGIGLTHTPDNIKLFAQLNVPLVFAGHTHGGGGVLPLIGPTLVPSRYGRFLDKGWFRFRDTRIYITPGIGYGCVAHQKGTIVEMTITSSVTSNEIPG